LLLCLIAVKDWAKPPSDHADPYHLGIRFVGFITAEFVVEDRFVLLSFYLLRSSFCWFAYGDCSAEEIRRPDCFQIGSCACSILGRGLLAVPIDQRAGQI
jgi:hypothetical protein